MVPTTITATDLRKQLFEVLNSARDGQEFVVKKDGVPAAKIVPYTPSVSMQEKLEILRNFREIMKDVPREEVSVFDTPEWKKKDKKYLEEINKPR